MKIKKITAAALMGVMLTFTGVSQAFGAQWVCPYNHENCQGQEYCDQHRDCVNNGSCVNGYGHENSCYSTTNSGNGSHHGQNRGCGGHRGGHHR